MERRSRERCTWECREHMSRRIIAIAILSLMVMACSSSLSPSKRAAISPSPAAGVSLGSLGSVGCAPAARFHGWRSTDGPPEVGLDSPRGSLWALFFNPVPPPAGKEIKVVWRMTGLGDITFRVSDAAGMVVPLAWGPVGHSGSNWDHPGDEVGTGFNFPHPGCWDIHVARSDTRGDLWLEVVA
jgi:hypothetical protein